MKRSDGFWWGGILIVLGGLLLLENLDFLRVGDVLRDYWPALLVLAGVWFLLRGKEERPRASSESGGSTEGGQLLGDIRATHTSDFASYSTVFGDSKIFVESKAFKGGTISTVFGDCILDCSRTGFSDGEQTIRVSGVFGDLSVLLPPGIAYTLGAHTLFGAIDAGQEHRDGFASTVRYRNPGYDAAQKKVRLELSGVFGDIMVHA